MATYRHRNGEMEPPAKYEHGDWWWNPADGEKKPLGFYPEVVHLHRDMDGNRRISFLGDKKYYRLYTKKGKLKRKFRGQWWGPIEKPPYVNNEEAQADEEKKVEYGFLGLESIRWPSTIGEDVIYQAVQAALDKHNEAFAQVRDEWPLGDSDVDHSE